MPDTAAAEVEEAKKAVKESNDDRKRQKLHRQIQRSHEWRVQVWAQMELKIRSAQAGLAVLGDEETELFEPDFTDDAMLHHYSTMPLTK